MPGRLRPSIAVNCPSVTPAPVPPHPQRSGSGAIFPRLHRRASSVAGSRPWNLQPGSGRAEAVDPAVSPGASGDPCLGARISWERFPSSGWSRRCSSGGDTQAVRARGSASIPGESEQPERHGRRPGPAGRGPGQRHRKSALTEGGGRHARRVRGGQLLSAAGRSPSQRQRRWKPPGEETRRPADGLQPAERLECWRAGRDQTRLTVPTLVVASGSMSVASGAGSGAAKRPQAWWS